MIGLVLMTHGQLGVALLDAASLIIGHQQRACAMTLERERPLDAARSDLLAAVDTVGCDGDGVLIMIDMFGGTPSNLSAPLFAPGAVEVLAGVNLPMVLKFFGSRQGASLGELVILLKHYGQQGILSVGELLQSRSGT